MTITYSETNKLWCEHQSSNVKLWWRNIGNKRPIDCLHMGEENHIRWIHMNHPCRIDRVAPYPFIPI